jgi:hypothetical protein
VHPKIIIIIIIIIIIKICGVVEGVTLMIDLPITILFIFETLCIPQNRTKKGVNLKIP